MRRALAGVGLLVLVGGSWWAFRGALFALMGPCPSEISGSTQIAIAVSGGGVVGGINPGSGSLFIQSDGEVSLASSSLLEGIAQERRALRRKTLEGLAKEMLSRGYWGLEARYGCGVFGSACDDEPAYGSSLPFRITLQIDGEIHSVESHAGARNELSPFEELIRDAVAESRALSRGE